MNEKNASVAVQLPKGNYFEGEYLVCKKNKIQG
jgi:hypothetical protein